MYCSKCGAETGEGSKFCSKCGAPMSDGAAQPAYPQTPAQPYQPYQPNQTYQPYQPYQNYQPYQPYYAVVPGSKMLKVTGILFIISGCLSILFQLVFISSYDVRMDAGAVIGLILGCLAPITVGIIGVKKHDDTSAARFFIIAGSVMIPFMIICVVLMSLGMYAPGYEITNFPGLPSIVLPILYIVGGSKNRSYANMQQNIQQYPPKYQ